MKDQYFGDINDYRKYGLLRTLVGGAHIRPFVAWMLTPDDGSSTGNSTRYLKNPSCWHHYDPELFKALQGWLIPGTPRQVAKIASSTLLPGAAFFSEPLTDSGSERSAWFGHLIQRCVGHDLVFLDPDNGIEVKSTSYGRPGSSRYVYWGELTELFAHRHSLLIYQHFPHRSRDPFRTLTAKRLAQELSIPQVITFETPQVLFFLAPQPKHEQALSSAVESVSRIWGDQLRDDVVQATSPGASPKPTPSLCNLIAPLNATGSFNEGWV